MQKLKPKGTSLTRNAVHAIARVMHFKNLSHDRKPQPAPGNAAAMVALVAIIPLPNVIQIFGRNTDAVINDLKPNGPRTLRNTYTDGAILLGIIDRVVKKVTKRMAKSRTKKTVSKYG